MSQQGKFSALKNWGSIEQISYWLVWSVLLFLPMIFWDFGDSGDQKKIIGGWLRILPFLLIFMVHNLVLLPQLLLKKRYLLYAITTLALILLINYWFIFSDSLHNFIIDIVEGRKKELQEGVDKIREHDMHRRGMHRKGRWGANYWQWRSSSYFIFTYNVIISLLVVGFNTMLKFATQWLRKDQQRKELEKETVQSQLMVLQNQVSPHFFMNTLNNIHALIDYNSDDAKDAVLRLSNMMRYLLYESDQGKTSLRKEIEFLQSYIDLMKLRLQPEVDLQVNFPKNIPDIEIYSLLTISFLENAFKHGINPRGHSFIHILLEMTDNQLHFNIKNSRIETNEREIEPGGIGIENAKKRLELLYGKRYHLNIYNREEEFEVDLIYPAS